MHVEPLFNSGLLVILHPRARAHEVAVAEDVVHAGDGRPELVVHEALHRESGLLARVGAIPVAGDLVGGVRRAFERVVRLVGLAALDRKSVV